MPSCMPVLLNKTVASLGGPGMGFLSLGHPFDYVFYWRQVEESLECKPHVDMFGKFLRQ